MKAILTFCNDPSGLDLTDISINMDSALTRMTPLQEQFHELDKKEYPERHWLTKDSYLKTEMLDMCTWCADHYKWNEKMEYDARTDRYYKREKEHENDIDIQLLGE